MAAWLLVSALALWLPGSASGAQNCAGGGAPRPDEGGIGGTGIRADRHDDEGGIGGTGIVAGDTGVIGTITGFASICVGGTEIYYDDKTSVQIDGQPAGVAALAVGQVVEVVAKGSGDEVWAQQIISSHIIRGPITAVDGGDGTIGVLGQRVQLSESTRLDEAIGDPAAGLKLNMPVQVSGMRRSDGVIVASRVGLGATGDTVQISGALAKDDASQLTVAGVPLLAEAGAAVHVGREVRVLGQWDGRGIAPASVDVIPALPFDGRVAHVDIEGYARASTAVGRVYLGSFLVEVPKDVAASAASLLDQHGSRMRVQAAVRDHHVVAERVAVAPELPRQSGAERPLGGGRGDKPSDGAHAGKHEHLGGENPAQPEAGDRGGWERGLDRHEVPAPEGGSPPERPDRPERHSFEVPGQSMPERPERPDKPERPNKPERPQPPDIPIVPDRPPRPERPETHGHRGR